MWRVLAVVVPAFALLWLTVSLTVASSVRRSRPDIAIRFAPYDSAALAILAHNLQTENPDVRGMIEAAGPARAALKRDLTYAVAVRALGFAQESRGQARQAAKLIRYANRLSKRDLLTELWLIEYNVDRGDVPAVLRHFDAAISTSPDAMRTLFPVLINALGDPDLVQPLADMLKRRPWWVASFLNQTALEAKSTANADALFVTLAKAGQPVRRDIVDALAVRIRAEGRAADAERLVREASGPASID